MPPASPVLPADRIPRTVWMLGFVSLLMDVSSEMIHGLLPLFMVTTLALSATTVGMIEGVAESTALIVKVFSGAISDYVGKRKSLAVLGYGMAALTKPLFALATGAGWIFFARFVDRIGKGIRGAPRDALIADVTPPALHGAAFGLRQSLDTVGAFLGPLLAIGLMLLWANDFRAVFWVAVIPAVLAVLLLVVGIREPATPAGAPRINPIRPDNLRRLGRDYWWVVAVGAEAFAKVSGGNAVVTRGEVAFSDLPHYFSSAKAEAELGYRISPIEPAISRAAEWFKHNGYV